MADMAAIPSLIVKFCGIIAVASAYLGFRSGYPMRLYEVKIDYQNEDEFLQRVSNALMIADYGTPERIGNEVWYEHIFKMMEKFLFFNIGKLQPDVYVELKDGNAVIRGIARQNQIRIMNEAIIISKTYHPNSQFATLP